MSGGGVAGWRTWLGRVRGFMVSRPPWVWWVLAVLVWFALVWELPSALYGDVTREDVRVKAFTDTRTALLAGLLGIGAVLTFWLNSKVYKITARTFELTEQGHITERYTKAIEQLGSKELDVRLGGIYALERIAVDSARDRPRSSRSSAPSSGNTATQLAHLAGGLLLLVWCLQNSRVLR